jgi:hypothetical protein
MYTRCTCRAGPGRAIEVIRPMISANLVLGLVTIAVAAAG